MFYGVKSGVFNLAYSGVAVLATIIGIS